MLHHQVVKQHGGVAKELKDDNAIHTVPNSYIQNVTIGPLFALDFLGIVLLSVTLVAVSCTKSAQQPVFKPPI